MPPAQPPRLLDLNFILHLAVILPCIVLCRGYQHQVLHPNELLRKHAFIALPPTWLLYIIAATLFFALFSLSNRRRTPDRSLSLALQCSMMAVFHVAGTRGDSFQTICLQYLPTVMLGAIIPNECWFGGVEIREGSAEEET